MSGVSYTGLFNAVVARLRSADTIFKDQVKLVLRAMSDEQWALMRLPYLLVVPTVTRVEGVGASRDGEYDSIINPRSITMLAQLDGRGSEADWRAAIDIEIAERQLISTLVNWRPAPWFRPSAYAGMRIEATRAPAVKVAFVFSFFEELFVVPDLDTDDCAILNNTDIQLDIRFGRIPLPEPPDPCDDPCEPCLPSRSWSAAEWLTEGETR